jgi:dihydrolipoamide dehydrogenase
MNFQDKINLDVIPSVVYSDPEIASVGITEKEAKESNIYYKVGVFPVLGNGRSLIEGTRNGFIKVISNENNVIIGVHMMCDFASEIISEAALMVGCHLNTEEIESIIHAHPTVYEALHEAIQDLSGESIHKA